MHAAYKDVDKSCKVLCPITLSCFQQTNLFKYYPNLHDI